MIDLAEEFNKQVAKIPGGSKYFASMAVDLGQVAVELANAWAEDMRENMMAGKRPDGSAPMPVRKTKGMFGRRGEGTGVVASISLRWSSARNRLVIAADEDDAGSLKRILRGIAFRPPATSKRIENVRGNAALIATLTWSARSKRGRAWSPKRLAGWRKSSSR